MTKLYDSFLTQLADVYDAEKQLIKALLKLAKAAHNQELKTAFMSNRSETEEHARQLEKVFEILNEKAPGHKCKGMEGLIAECEDCIQGDFGDALLICAAQKIEHYEIAIYGCLRSWAQLLDQDEATNLLEEILDEESDADEYLTSIAMRMVNPADGETGENGAEEWETEHAARGDGSEDR